MTPNQLEEILERGKNSAIDTMDYIDTVLRSINAAIETQHQNTRRQPVDVSSSLPDTKVIRR
jgi:uncharacterized protein YgbK (DUF1537 family)